MRFWASKPYRRRASVHQGGDHCGCSDHQSSERCSELHVWDMVEVEVSGIGELAICELVLGWVDIHRCPSFCFIDVPVERPML